MRNIIKLNRGFVNCIFGKQKALPQGRAMPSGIVGGMGGRRNPPTIILSSLT